MVNSVHCGELSRYYKINIYRPNVFLMFKSEQEMDLLKELEWLLNDIRQNGKDAQKQLYMSGN
jgi:hypothetical protein